MKKIMIFFSLEFLQKFSDFVNSDNCIGKIISKSIRIYPVYIIKKIVFASSNCFTKHVLLANNNCFLQKQMNLFLQAETISQNMCYYPTTVVVVVVACKKQIKIELQVERLYGGPT